MKQAARGSLLGIEHLGAAEILGLLKLARRMNPLKPRPLLRGKRVLLLFYEASTRTRSSFEIAAKSLGAMTTLVLSSGSSIEKGESLLDTGYTLRAVGADVIVIRHPQAGAAALMARYLDIPVINAGRRNARASFAGVARCLHDPAPQENAEGIAGRNRRRHLSQPGGAVCDSSAQQVRGAHHAYAVRRSFCLRPRSAWRRDCTSRAPWKMRSMAPTWS